MSAQPQNTEIKVYRRARAQMTADRYSSVKALTGEMRPLQVIVPGEEVQILSTKDAVVTDAWRFGHQVVKYVKDTKSVGTVYQTVDGLGFPVRLTNQRRDIQIEKDADHVSDDLFTEVQNA